jgi:hypothetical protein
MAHVFTPLMFSKSCPERKTKTRISGGGKWVHGFPTAVKRSVMRPFAVAYLLAELSDNLSVLPRKLIVLDPHRL